MEYVYGTSTRSGQVCKNLKTVGQKHSDLSGYVSTVREFADGTKINDHCRIVEKYASKEADGLCYDWYRITDHYRETDTTAKAQAAADKLTANLDYLSMMAGVDIPGGEADGTQSEI